MDGFTSGTSFRNFKRAFENKAPIVCSVAKERLGVKSRDQIQVSEDVFNVPCHSLCHSRDPSGAGTVSLCSAKMLCWGRNV